MKNPSPLTVTSSKMRDNLYLLDVNRASDRERDALAATWVAASKERRKQDVLSLTANAVRLLDAMLKGPDPGSQGHSLIEWLPREFGHYKRDGKSLIMNISNIDWTYINKKTTFNIPDEPWSPATAGTLGLQSRYVYYSNTGWLDVAHTDPGSANVLLNKIRAEKDDLTLGHPEDQQLEPIVNDRALRRCGIADVRDQYFLIAFQVRPGTSRQKAAHIIKVFAVKKNLTKDQQLFVGLGIWKHYQYEFEKMQQLAIWSGSGFSQEDLPSDTVAFYRAAYGWKTDKQFEANVSVGTKLDAEGTYRLYVALGRDLTTIKNHSFDKPINHNSCTFHQILTLMLPAAAGVRLGFSISPSGLGRT